VSLLAQFAAAFSPTGDIARDARALLVVRGYGATAEHCAAVAGEAVRLATRFGADPVAARRAGWLHDISAIVPRADRLRVAEAWGLPVLPEERACPMILHQKLSRSLAERLFSETDVSVLSAIGCHTTLRPSAGLLDQVLFVADKVAWDQPGEPPYHDALSVALQSGELAGAAYAYLSYLWEHRHMLDVVHPWMVSAYEDLTIVCRAE
jgi:predicted HD superfamily hydrolase involved in NAD metabolism